MKYNKYALALAFLASSAFASASFKIASDSDLQKLATELCLKNAGKSTNPIFSKIKTDRIKTFGLNKNQLNALKNVQVKDKNGSKPGEAALYFQMIKDVKLP